MHMHMYMHMCMCMCMHVMSCACYAHTHAPAIYPPSAPRQVLLLSKYWETQGALATSDNAKVLFFPPKATVPLTYEGLKEVVQGSE